MERLSFMKLVPSAKEVGDHWSIGSLTYGQSCVKSVGGLTTELKWLVWERAGPQAFFYQDIQDKWNSQFKHNLVGIHSSEYGGNLSIIPPSSNTSTSVNSGLGTQLKSSQYAMSICKGLVPQIT